ncbi:MAG: hypothetical protein RMK18_08530 [Armatimonadota bacterium]|nr:hypothetical protein [Armatimonadota bacterium]MCX7777642.1 hypothetical protein [Armatimonadota bacterium]MDW8025888.1 hypothetical protein [Armatimonadota bacterium]
MSIDERTVEIITYFVAAACTLGIYTILYRENRLFRLFEHIFIGVAAGYGLAITITEVLEPRWFKPMVTENAIVVNACDNLTGWEGALPNERFKMEGKASIRWDVKGVRVIRFVAPPANWIDARYIKLWLHSPKPTNGSIILRILTGNETGNFKGRLSGYIPIDFSGWREVKLYLRNLSKEGEIDLKSVRIVEFVADDALVKAGVTLHIDNVRHCIGRKWYWILALVGGLLYYTIFIPRFAWMSRLVIGAIMGLQSGYVFKAFVLTFYPQIAKSLRPIYVPGDISLTLNNIVFVVTLLCVLIYFFFTIEHKHPTIRTSALIGRLFLMVTFGLIFGNTVMARFSLFIKRLDFLITQFPWLK